MVVGALRSTTCVLLFCFLQQPSCNLHFLVSDGFSNSLVRLDGCRVGTILLGTTGILLLCFLQEPSSSLCFLFGGFKSLIHLGGCSGSILLGSITLSDPVILSLSPVCLEVLSCTFRYGRSRVFLCLLTSSIHSKLTFIDFGSNATF